MTAVCNAVSLSLSPCLRKSRKEVSGNCSLAASMMISATWHLRQWQHHTKHLIPVEPAVVGVLASVFNLVSKLFNVPLLNFTTAFVAEEKASLTKDGDYKSIYSDQNGLQRKKVLPSVSTSLVLAAVIGVAEASSTNALCALVHYLIKGSF
ncbi:hypothetical protein DCAR_0933960 [Daucus carota subsp. sativus]|uniref:Uncharacterized protein n=1 Tax=Daucus carota subsp. sativus TaxID=79200 RepID=A0AAF0XU81_DAUCS|nr:hypothetical protein DCAR_0933960 [Daucus carota subsp. sativus]